MNPLNDTSFMNLLSASRPCRREELESAYDDFVRTVIEVCDNTTDYKLLFRILTHTQVRLEILYPSRTRVKSNAGEVSASCYIAAAKRIVQSELSLLNERVVIRRCYSRHVKTIFRICFGVRSSRSGIW